MFGVNKVMETEMHTADMSVSDPSSELKGYKLTYCYQILTELV